MKATVAVLLLCAVSVAHSGSVVTINADKVLVINGRKVFPILMSPGPPTHGRTPTGRDALEELREAGVLMIRMLQTNDWNARARSEQQAQLDWAQQHGMFCMVNLRELSAFAADDSKKETALRDLVKEFKNHPALGLWKNKDEAWWGKVSAADLRRGYDVIKQEDANHPIEQTHAPRGKVSDLRPYNATADILALDIYPVSEPPGKHSLLPNKQISMVGDWTKFLADVANGEKSYWMIEQIAFSGVIPPKSKLIFPTFRQSRYMAYQAIIRGARGLMFFGGNIAPTLNAQDAPLGWNWTFWNDVLKRVVREIGDKSPLAEALVASEPRASASVQPGVMEPDTNGLVGRPVLRNGTAEGGDSVEPITITGATSPDVEFCVREIPSAFFILGSKREGSPATVTFRGLPSWAATAEVLYESGRIIKARDGQFTDTFEPFDVHVYRFSK